MFVAILKLCKKRKQLTEQRKDWYVARDLLYRHSVAQSLKTAEKYKNRG